MEELRFELKEEEISSKALTVEISPVEDIITSLRRNLW